MRVKVIEELQYAPGSGTFTNTYQPGDVIETSDGAGAYFVDKGVAEETDADLFESTAPAVEVEAVEEPVEDPPKGPKATDSAIKLAAEKAVDLSAVTASGKDGQITFADVQKAAKAGE